MTEQTENGRFVWVAGALCRLAQSSVRQLDRERREGIPSARSGAPRLDRECVGSTPCGRAHVNWLGAWAAGSVG
jgi:hypothetical protein